MSAVRAVTAPQDAQGTPDAPDAQALEAPLEAPQAPEVLCPLCKVPAQAQALRCPSCREDLSVLFRLRYAGRIDYNGALDALAAGNGALALGLLHRAVAAEPGLHPALELLESLSVAAPAGAVRGGRGADTP
ncbi:hypothetical protein ACFWP2_33240 [Kitasatospora sp. NPDC058444]|uniref:hypothetical protein n=1 Tax=Kitasatospora sp. NPDC058444 TaxID=3346504 RepID=UPI00365CF409